MSAKKKPDVPPAPVASPAPRRWYDHAPLSAAPIKMGDRWYDFANGRWLIMTPAGTAWEPAPTPPTVRVTC